MKENNKTKKKYRYIEGIKWQRKFKSKENCYVREIAKRESELFKKIQKGRKENNKRKIIDRWKGLHTSEKNGSKETVIEGNNQEH